MEQAFAILMITLIVALNRWGHKIMHKRDNDGIVLMLIIVVLLWQLGILLGIV